MDPIKPFYLDLTEDEINDISVEMGNVLRSGQLILSKHTEGFEAAFASYCGATHGISYNTATSALEVLCVLNGAKGRKVAVASNTNFASAEAIIRAGGTPFFMDMTKEHLSPNLDHLKNAVENHGCTGVMWVHIGGIIVPDWLEIVAYCKANDVFLVEDCAHAHGSWIAGKAAGTFGQGGAYSFFPTKVMTTMEGGMIITDDAETDAAARSFRNQGKRHAAYGGLHYDHGNSWRISEIAAYIGMVQTAKLDAMVARRQAGVDIVAARMREIGVEYCDTSHMDKASHYKFLILAPEGVDVAATKKALADRGIMCGGAVYDVPCHLQPVFADVAFDRAALQVTETWCPRQICPPITSGITPADAERIADALGEVLG